MPNLSIAFDARHLSSKVLRGMDRYTVGLVKELIKLGVKVTLFHRKREPLNFNHISNLGCDVLGIDDYGGLYWEQIAVPIALAKKKIDLYHAPAERGVPLLAPCPVVFSIHSLTGNSYYDFVQRGLLSGTVSDYLGHNFDPNTRNFWVYLSKAQLLRANLIITPSEFCRSEVIRFLNIPSDKVTVSSLAIHEQFEKPPLPENERFDIITRLGIKKPYLLYVGGYEVHKNVSGLLKAFALISKVRPDLMLVLVGSKFVPEVLQKAAFNLNVLFLVDITHDLTEIYDSSELFISLSWRETFCLPALEAMSRGIRVIGSKWGAFLEVVGEAGQIVNPDDYEQVTDKVIEIINSNTKNYLSSLLIQQAKKFSWKKTGAETLSLYQDLLGLQQINYDAEP